MNLNVLCSMIKTAWMGELDIVRQGLLDCATPNTVMQVYDRICTGLKEQDIVPAAACVHQLQRLSWDQLHLGHWKDVHVAWRDVYALTCLITASLELMHTESQDSVPIHQHSDAVPVKGLPSTVENQLSDISSPPGLQQPDHDVMKGQVLHQPAQHSEQRQQQHVGTDDEKVQANSKVPFPHDSAMSQAAALDGEDRAHGLDEKTFMKIVRDLDLGIMMGGPTFKQLLHQAVASLEQHWKASQQQPRQVYTKRRYPTTNESMLHSHGTDEEGHHGKRRNLGHQDQLPLASNAAAVDDAADAAVGASDDQSPQQTCNDNNTGTSGPCQKDFFEDCDVSLMQQAGSEVSLAQQDLSQLPPGSLQLSDLATPVPELHLPALDVFLEQCMLAGGSGMPTIITGAMTAWPALTRWQDLAYLRQVAGHRTIPVEVGKHYLSEGWGQRLMTFNDFLDMHMLEHPQQPTDASSRCQPDRLHHGAVASHTQNVDARCEVTEDRIEINDQDHDNAVATKPAGTQSVGYLAQHPLFDQIPALFKDVMTPEYCALGKDEEEGGGIQSINAWLGPKGTVTPLHTDPHHNLLCQVVGTKYIRLYAPDETPGMYPFKEGLTTNSSQVDLHNPDPHAFPEFAKAPYFDCVLLPGCMLYIPPGWWHFVQSMSTSFSVSFWWQ